MTTATLPHHPAVKEPSPFVAFSAPKPKGFYHAPPLSRLGRCDVFFFEDGSAEYGYMTREPRTNWRDGHFVGNPLRFALLERAVNTATGVLAVKVHLTGEMVERMNDFIGEATKEAE